MSLGAPTVAAETWTESTEADFLQGTLASVHATAGGDLELNPGGNWSKVGIVLDTGPDGSYDSVRATTPFVLRESDGTYKMWYVGFDGNRNRMLFATSTDGFVWTKRGIAIDVQQPPWSFDSVGSVSVLREGATYHMWFHGGFWSGGPAGFWGQIYYATSADGQNWSIHQAVLGLGPPGAWDGAMLHSPWVLRGGDGIYRMYYHGWDGSVTRIGLALSSSHVAFTRWGTSPILSNGPPGSWDQSWLETPNIAIGSPWTMYYSGFDPTPRIGAAVSSDGFNWTKSVSNPLLAGGPRPAWDSEGVRQSALLADPSGDRLYYGGSDGSRTRTGLALASGGLYSRLGFYTSRAFDSGSGGTRWRTISWNATVSPTTSVEISARSGDTVFPDSTWSAWSPPATTPSGTPLGLPRTRYVQYRAVLSNTDGNATPALHEVTLVYDPDDPPVVQSVDPSGGAWTSSAPPQLRWTSSDPQGDPQAAFEVQLSPDSTFALSVISSGIQSSATQSWQAPGLGDGRWYWRVRVADEFGAWSDWAVDSFRVDGTSPSISFTSPASGGIIDARDVTVTWTAADSGSGIDHIEVRLDSGPTTMLPPDTTSFTFRGVADFSHTVHLTAIDRAGNSMSVSTTITVDTAVLSPKNKPVQTAVVLGAILSATAALVAVALYRDRKKRR